MDKNEVNEVARELVGWEGNKIFRTVKYLTTKPGQLISEYCQGEKEKYLSPVVYFFGVSGVVFYLQTISPLTETTKTIEAVQTLFTSFGMVLSTKKTSDFVSILFNQTFLTVLILPVSLIITWFVFIKHNRSFKQSSWFTLYTAGHANLLMIPAILCFLITQGTIFALINSLSTLLLYVYVVWAAMQFYKIEIGRSILLSIVRFLVLGISYSLTIGLLVFFIYYFD